MNSFFSLNVLVARICPEHGKVLTECTTKCAYHCPEGHDINALEPINEWWERCKSAQPAGKEK